MAMSCMLPFSLCIVKHADIDTYSIIALSFDTPGQQESTGEANFSSVNVYFIVSSL